MNTTSPWNKQSARSGFTLVELLVVIAIIGILVAMLLPAVQAARESARRLQCGNNLKQIGLAILNYESQNGTLPTSVAHYDEGGIQGTGFGWSVGILPHLEQQALYQALDYTGTAFPAGKGAFNAQNHQYIKQPLAIYRCPSDSPRQLVKTNVWQAVPANLPLAVANYAGVIGPHDVGDASVFGGEDDCHNFTVSGKKRCSGVLWRHSIMAPVKVFSYRDGASNTFLVGEVLPDYDDFVVWAISNGMWSSTHAPLNYTPPPPLNAWDWVNQRGFRSRHAGGAQFVFADGHVTFVSDSIDMTTYRGLSTRDGGEVVGL
jgi:prepilin-type N-terminal cleavage/methylation domain-containing protein/prepilin-type processing-associated H-X9-DG protein